METFLQLPAGERRQLCNEARARLGLPAASIEKDFWVCWTLRELFALPSCEGHLTFKGGTSLSKGWQLIDRFSEDIDLFELHDAFSIMSVLALEACGFAERGRGVELGESGAITLGGKLPITTMGGLKARGHPVGATGMYQVVEVVQQLRGEAGANQVAHAHIGMTQNIGGSGATIITHILMGEG